jgi:hypothetical protein
MIKEGNTKVGRRNMSTYLLPKLSQALSCVYTVYSFCAYQ